jgi:hypothetical protein
MPVGIAATDVEGIYEEQKRLNGCLDGTHPGIAPETPNEQDVEGSQYQAFKKQCKTYQEYAKAVYEYAMKRDMPYCVYGRKAMRVQAASGKIFAALDRGLALNQIELEEKNK